MVNFLWSVVVCLEVGFREENEDGFAALLCNDLLDIRVVGLQVLNIELH